jgi:hypothetical protein
MHDDVTTTQSPAPAVWTIDDFNARLCGFEDIDKPKPDLAQAVEMVETLPADSADMEVLANLPSMTDAEISAVSVRVLRTATIRVFARLGGEQWLLQLAREDASAFTKVLMRLLPQQVEAQVSVTTNQIPLAIRNLTTDDLSAMIKAGSAGKSVVDGEFEMVAAR